MITSSSPSTTLPPSKLQRGPKPAVCDLCHLWKVKCDKARPSCSKCLDLKVECKYSRSGPRPLPVVRPKGVRTYAKRKSKNSELQGLVFPARPLGLTVLSKNTFVNKFGTHPPKPFTSPTKPLESSFPTPSQPSKLKETSVTVPSQPNRNSVENSLVLTTKPTRTTNLNLPYQNNLTRRKLPSNFNSSVVDILVHLNDKLGSVKPTLIWEEGNGNYFCTGKSIASGFLRTNASMFPEVPKPYKLPNSAELSRIPVISQITDPLQNQLLDLYFGCLNVFYPVVHPATFYAKLAKPHHNIEFKALLCAVLLLGSTFHPNTPLSKGLGALLSCQLEKYLKVLYLKSSLEMVQVFALFSFHITTCELVSISSSAWFYLGLGQRMATQLGFQASHHKRSRHLNQVYRRTYWILIMNEILIKHATGLPSWQGAELLPSPPDCTTVYPSMNIVSQDIFNVKEVLYITPLESSHFFHHFCLYIRLLTYFDLPRHRQPLPEEGPVIRPQSNLSLLLVGESPPPLSKPYQEHFHNLELGFHKWYRDLPNFHKGQVQVPGVLTIPHPQDMFGNMFFVYFMAALVDLNKVQLSHKDQKLDEVFALLASEPCLLYRDLRDQHPLGKCVLASHLAADAICQSGTLLPEVAAPYFWYCIVQIVFFLSLTLEHLPPHHPLRPRVLHQLKTLQRLMERYALRWVVIRDSYTLVLALFKKWLP